MTPEIYHLFSDNRPLPPTTLLRGELLSSVALESANRCPNHMSDYVPFWILGWRDLHDQLSIPSS